MNSTRTRNLVLLAGLAVLVVAAVLGVLWRRGAFDPAGDKSPASAAAPTAPPLVAYPTPPPVGELTATVATTGTATTSGDQATPRPIFSPLQLPEVTPPPGGQIYQLRPSSGSVGWALKGDDKPNAFGDYNIYSGFFDGKERIGAMQFDLSTLPKGAAITYADLSLTGLSDEWLRKEGDATWTVNLLEPWMDADWQKKSYADFIWAYAAAGPVVDPLRASDLGVRRTNTIQMDPEALTALEARVFNGKASFDIRGPAGPEDNLFSWDTGFGPESVYGGPVLRIVTGPAPSTPPPSPTPVYVIITPAPTVENVVTAAAIAMATETEKVRLFGTATPTATPDLTQAAAAAGVPTVALTPTSTPTPLPPTWMTPIIVTPTPTPANEATVQWDLALATAQALVNGPATPTPPNVWTATPVPFIVVTNTPTASNAGAALAQAAAVATRWAAEGTPTPFPSYVATATPDVVLVTATPKPVTEATAQVIELDRRITILLKGTLTPTPANWVTPTPLPLLIPFDVLTATPTPALTWQTLPGVLNGKILFLSDRLSGDVGEPDVFVMNPDGSDVLLMTQLTPYQLSEARDAIASDASRRLKVEDDPRGVPQIYLEDPRYEGLFGVTSLTGMAYDPAWAPGSDRIAFTTTEDRNDEIYTINADGTDQQRLTVNDWEWDKHPSWSPDGSQIVFYSNRDTGRRQIWLMQADGSGQRNIGNTEYNDWNPVWIKTTDLSSLPPAWLK